MLLWFTELKISDMDEWIDSDDDSDDSDDDSEEKKDREEKDEKDKKKKTKKGVCLYYVEGMAIKLLLTFTVCAVLSLVH